MSETHAEKAPFCRDRCLRSALGSVTEGWLGALTFISIVATSPLAGCERTVDVPVYLDYGGSSTDAVANHFVGVFSWEDCGDASAWMTSMFPLGDIPEQIVDDQVFTGDRGDEIGELAPATYSFVALAWDEDCAVLFVGCVESTVGQDEEVVIEMRPDEDEMLACIDCNAGFCGW